LPGLPDLHGLISGNLGYLLEMYMLQHLIRFMGLEDFSIKIPAIASAQADKASSETCNGGHPGI
jgi:hypothetical protein